MNVSTEPLSEDQGYVIERYIYRVVRKAWLLGAFVIVGIVLALIYNTMAPKLYQSSATFFSVQESQSFQLSGVLGSLGRGGASDTNSKILLISKSRRLKKSLASSVVHLFPDKKESQIGGVLNFKHNFSVNLDKNGLFTVRFYHQDPQVAYEIVKNYLISLERINVDLELSPHKENVRILDGPVLAKHFSKPNKLFNVFVSVFLSVVLFFCYSILETVALYLIGLNKDGKLQ